MKRSDRDLGMNRAISRRDILHGFGALTAGAAARAMFPLSALAGQVQAASQISAGAYPPALTGMRGNHPGSFDVAHQQGRQGRRGWGPVQALDNEVYDLVVVGAGISGLAAAHFYLKQHPRARILLLDNHDDFGGHAKRNEFQIGDRTLIGYGGSQTLQEPSGYSPIVKGLLDDLGVDLKRLESGYDQGFYKRHGLGAGIHFNRREWGVDQVVPFKMGYFDGYLPVAPSRLSVEDAVTDMPICDAAKIEFKRLLLTDADQIPEIPADEKWDYLSTISYRDFLIKHLDIHESDVFKLLQDLAPDSGVGIDAVSAWSALGYEGLPGREAAGLAEPEEAEAYVHHFPDGNAAIARLLVRQMIPAVAAGTTMDDVVTARFDYSALDQADWPVQLRLNSTVTHVEHVGDHKSAQSVRVSFVRNGQAYRVQAKGCLLACNNAAIPHLCPELPEAQREALARQVKSPILYTNVVIRNWQAWKNMGIGALVCPGGYHSSATLDFPVSLGGYEFSGDPDEPIIVHMERFPHRNNEGLTSHEQFRLGRYELLGTSFETIERNVRDQLASMLGEGGFDPARDILGITVNRWAHGYASWYNSLYEPVYDDDDDERYPHMQARKRFGRITIANADSAANAMFEAAVEQGHRAVTELI